MRENPPIRTDGREMKIPREAVNYEIMTRMSTLHVCWSDGGWVGWFVNKPRGF